MKPLKHIVAVNYDGGIGNKGKLPWHFSEDLKHFKQITTGHICIMGRRTYADIRGHRPEGELLPGRQCFVLSRSKDFTPDGAQKVGSWREAAEQIPDEDPRMIFIIGGQQLFTETFPFVDYIYCTVVKGTHEVDTYYPTEQVERHFNLVNVVDKDGNKIAQGQKTDQPLLFFEFQRMVEQQPPRIIKR
jgi:dihydrofolate reductase